ncbi:unnamed protein product [Symbiodinium necroappetens]|uniref:Uncharacterized protein n=1 Tax=Symbiodinium necroappetens TaxID=1628268 RepID=A0A813AXT6_9DINO|nr:unnamed protein product [Symbiodinium necroappetens]
MVKESRGHCSEMTRMFARAGCSGKYPGNVERDIMRCLELPVDIHYVQIPVLAAANRRERTMMNLPILYPHELIHYLHESGKVNITQDFTPPPITKGTLIVDDMHSQAMMTGGLLSWEGGTFPRLDLKAWNSRLMTAYFHVVLRRVRETIADDVDPLLRKEVSMAFACTNSIAAFMDQMERASRYLTPSEAQIMADAISGFLRLWEGLALISQRRQVPRWKAVPKHHTLRHLSEDQLRNLLNCRHFHSFVDEDFIGFWKGLVQAVPKELLEFRCLTRYLLRLKVQH